MLAGTGEFLLFWKCLWEGGIIELHGSTAGPHVPPQSFLSTTQILPFLGEPPQAQTGQSIAKRMQGNISKSQMRKEDM
jgi:hypothetical protein